MASVDLLKKKMAKEIIRVDFGLRICIGALIALFKLLHRKLEAFFG